MALPSAYCLGRCAHGTATDPALLTSTFQITLTRDIPAPTPRGSGEGRTLVVYVMCLGRSSATGVTIDVADDAGNAWLVARGSGAAGGGSPNLNGAIAIGYIDNALAAGQKITVTISPAFDGAGQGAFGYAAADCLEFVGLPRFTDAGRPGNGDGAVNTVGAFVSGVDGQNHHTLNVVMEHRQPNVLFGLALTSNWSGLPNWDLEDFVGISPDPGAPGYEAIGESDPGPHNGWDESETQFDCAWNPGIFTVFVGGVLQYPSQCEMNPLFRVFNTAPPTGSYNLQASQYAGDVDVTPNNGGAFAILTSGVSPRGAFALTVQDPCTGLLVEGLRVDLFFGGVETSRYTDSNGFVLFSDLDPGIYIYQYGTNYDSPQHQPGGTIGTNSNSFTLSSGQVLERSELLNRSFGCPGGVGGGGGGDTGGTGVGLGIDCAEPGGVGTWLGGDD